MRKSAILPALVLAALFLLGGCTANGSITKPSASPSTKPSISPGTTPSVSPSTVPDNGTVTDLPAEAANSGAADGSITVEP